MNNLNHPLRVNKNIPAPPPLPFFEKINDGTEKKIEENIENDLVFCIDPRKAFAIKSIPRSVFFFEIRYIRTKYVYFYFG